MHRCIVGVGSNIDPNHNIPKALELLSQVTEIMGVSSFIITKPIGFIEQADFSNGAVKLLTQLDQQEFKSTLRNIEDQLKRDRSGHPYGPRTIDLDIVVWDDKIVDKDYYIRDFIRKSVDELLPF